MVPAFDLTGLTATLALIAYTLVSALALVVVLVIFWLRVPEKRFTCRPHIMGALAMLTVTVLCGLLFIGLMTSGWVGYRFVQFLDIALLLVFPLVMVFTWRLTMRLSKTT